jgi:hypothetical protein
MKNPSAANIRGRFDALLPFSGAVTEGAKKLGHTDGALVGRALKLFSASHPSDKGKRILTHVKGANGTGGPRRRDGQEHLSAPRLRHPVGVYSRWRRA